MRPKQTVLWVVFSIAGLLGFFAISEIAKLPRDVTLFLFLIIIIQVIMRVQISALNELKQQLTEGRLATKHEPFDELWGKTVRCETLRCDSILQGGPFFGDYGIGIRDDSTTSSTTLSINQWISARLGPGGTLSLHEADGQECAAIRVRYGEVMFRIGGPSNMWMTIPPTTWS